MQQLAGPLPAPLAGGLVFHRLGQGERQRGAISRRHHPARLVLAQHPAHRAPGAGDHRTAGGHRVEEPGAQGEPRLQARPVRRHQEVHVAQQVVTAVGRHPIDTAHAGPPPAEAAAMRLDLGEQALRRRARIRIADEQQGPGGLLELLQRREEGPRVVPVVEAAEQEPPLAGRGRIEDGPVRRQLLGHAEGDRGDQVRQIGVHRDALRVDPAQGGEKAEVEAALLLGRAEEEVAAGHLEDPGRMVVAPGIEAEALDVAQVLDQPRVIEIEGHGQMRAFEHQVVAELPLCHRGGAVGQDLAQPAGLEAAHRHVEPQAPRLLGVGGRDEDHVDAEPRQTPGELEIADADPRHARADGLAGEEGDAGHALRCHHR